MVFCFFKLPDNWGNNIIFQEKILCNMEKNIFHEKLLYNNQYVTQFETRRNQQGFSNKTKTFFPYNTLKWDVSTK